MHEVLVNRLGGLSLPRKSVVRLTDRPDMTLDVYRGRKTTIQQQQQQQFTLLQVNYLSHFLLIGKLLPDMKKNGDDVRIVLVSAGLHKWPIIKYDINQMNYSGDANKYSAINCYGTSKLYQVRFSVRAQN